MITTSDALAPFLSLAVDGIKVADDGLSATVGGEDITADSPHQLAQRLGPILYQTVHVGRDKPESSRPRTLRDPQFDQLLADAMPHRTTLASAVINERVDESTLLATVDGLRVFLPAGNLTGPLPDPLPASAPVRLPAARPALSTGFFLTDGSAGTASGSYLLRLYIHVTSPDAAPSVWNAALSVLEEHQLPYRAKITSSPRMFPRRDALVVYLGPPAWRVVPAVAARVSAMEGLGADTSPFTHNVAPGVAAAWEPQDSRPGMRALSFGEHRSGALAEALVKHAVGLDGPSLSATYEESFMDAGIDPANCARNVASPALAAIGLV